MMAALGSAIPQLIIPGHEDTTDQLFHGRRIDTIGCGRLLRPRVRIDEDMQAPWTVEVVDAVRTMLEDISSFKETCLSWQKRLEGSRDVEGVPVAVDTLRRLIAKILLGTPVDQVKPSVEIVEKAEPITR